MIEGSVAGQQEGTFQVGQRPERCLPDDFWMYEYKVTLCSNRSSHSWENCIYAHRGERARRRHPSKYQAVQCPEARAKKACPRGEDCPCTHHLFEYWLHPDRYLTCLCELGPTCDRPICFFAHQPSELRPLPAGLSHPDIPSGAQDPNDLSAAQQQKQRRRQQNSSGGGTPGSGARPGLIYEIIQSYGLMNAHRISGAGSGSSRSAAVSGMPVGAAAAAAAAAAAGPAAVALPGQGSSGLSSARVSGSGSASIAAAAAAAGFARSSAAAAAAAPAAAAPDTSQRQQPAAPVGSTGVSAVDQLSGAFKALDLLTACDASQEQAAAPAGLQQQQQKARLSDSGAAAPRSLPIMPVVAAYPSSSAMVRPSSLGSFTLNSQQQQQQQPQQQLGGAVEVLSHPQILPQPPVQPQQQQQQQQAQAGLPIGRVSRQGSGTASSGSSSMLPVLQTGAIGRSVSDGYTPAAATMQLQLQLQQLLQQQQQQQQQQQLLIMQGSGAPTSSTCSSPLGFTAANPGSTAASPRLSPRSATGGMDMLDMGLNHCVSVGALNPVSMAPTGFSGGGMAAGVAMQQQQQQQQQPGYVLLSTGMDAPVMQSLLPGQMAVEDPGEHLSFSLWGAETAFQQQQQQYFGQHYAQQPQQPQQYMLQQQQQGVWQPSLPQQQQQQQLYVQQVQHLQQPVLLVPATSAMPLSNAGALNPSSSPAALGFNQQIPLPGSSQGFSGFQAFDGQQQMLMMQQQLQQQGQLMHDQLPMQQYRN